MTSLPTGSNNPAPAPVQKQRLNVYTVMLLIMFIALCLGCVMLYQEVKKYDGWDTSTVSPTSWVVPAESGFASSRLLS